MCQLLHKPTRGNNLLDISLRHQTPSSFPVRVIRSTTMESPITNSSPYRSTFPCRNPLSSNVLSVIWKNGTFQNSSLRSASLFYIPTPPRQSMLSPHNSGTSSRVNWIDCALPKRSTGALPKRTWNGCPNQQEKRNVEGVDLKRSGKERSWGMIVSTIELHAVKLELSLTNHGNNSSVTKSITVQIQNNVGPKSITFCTPKIKINCNVTLILQPYNLHSILSQQNCTARPFDQIQNYFFQHHSATTRSHSHWSGISHFPNRHTIQGFQIACIYTLKIIKPGLHYHIHPENLFFHFFGPSSPD